MTQHIQGKDGKFAGSIGDGKRNVPTVSDPLILDRTLMRAAVDAAFAQTGEASFDDVYAAYQAAKAKQDAADLVARQDAEAQAAAKLARVAFWATFEAAPGICVPASYESHEHLPVGTIVRLEGSATSGGFWNGHRWVKTGDATWAVVGGRTAGERAERARASVAAQASNVSPCPQPRDGEWIIEAVVAA